MKIGLAVVLLLAMCMTTSTAKVVQAHSEADVFRINDEYPSRYSVVIFNGAEYGLLNRISSVFGETKQAQQHRELGQIVDFFEKESHYGIPIIEANVDNADYTNIRAEWNVTSIPWIVILDENNVVSYSKEPIEEADEEILLVMNIFPTTIMKPPSDSDEIIFDDDVVLPGEYGQLNTRQQASAKNAQNDDFGATVINISTGGVRPKIPGELRLGPQMYGEDMKRNQRDRRGN